MTSKPNSPGSADKEHHHVPAVQPVYHAPRGAYGSITVAVMPKVYALYDHGDAELGCPAEVRWWLLALPNGQAVGVPADGSSGTMVTTLAQAAASAGRMCAELVKVRSRW